MQRLTQDKKNSYAEGVTWKRDRGTQIRNPRAEATIASIFASIFATMAADLGGLLGDCGGTAEAGDLWMAVSGLGTGSRSGEAFADLSAAELVRLC